MAEVNGLDNLKRAFNDHYQENANLEQLHLTNVYQQLVERVCGTTKFYIGPRGNRSSSFKIYLKDSAGIIAEFPYIGQEEPRLYIMDGRLCSVGRGQAVSDNLWA